ncbi:hypothetical protein Cs7R123_44670 [Catellatospora sp. TT07R-123]|uniref:hypothetical protein n=1 Tax=Catellatospora sp. TT07R-123 TaxID=2733863 RepID=UPI001B006AD5|nr:hypothetical protein [Catellatospora sp. TT07R-123]GHJ47125.1 hypothetical protein Cs7R123_44670 [Catellatospora sp. TT07R-123]
MSAHHSQGRASDDDRVFETIQRIADGTAGVNDREYLKTVLSNSRGITQIGGHNYYVESSGAVHIGDRYYTGPSAAVLRGVVEDSIEDAFDDIPRGGLRSFGGLLRGAGILISTGSVGIYFARIGFFSDTLDRTSFATAAAGAVVGSVITGLGAVIQGWERPRSHRNPPTPPRPPGRTAAPGPDPGDHHAAGTRSAPLRGFGGLLQTVGYLGCIAGMCMFFYPLIGFMASDMHTPPSGEFPPLLARQGIAVFGIGAVLSWVGRVLDGVRRR